MTDHPILFSGPMVRAELIGLKACADCPVRMDALAEELGLRVTRTPLPPVISGLIQPSSVAPSGFEIKVNKYNPPRRQRFTVAREIAHYLLHRDDIGSGLIDSFMYRSRLPDAKDAEANRLAADITMPAEAVAKELKRLGGTRNAKTVAALAAIFRVPNPAMRARLGNSAAVDDHFRDITKMIELGKGKAVEGDER